MTDDRRRRAAAREEWRRRRDAAWGPGRGAGWRGRPRRGFAPFGCLLVAFVAFIGLVSALATWVAGVVLGVIAPSAAPASAATTLSVVVVIVIAILLGARTFGGAIRPLAEIADATERLADGDDDVRVAPVGPRPVRGLATSFNAMAERLHRARADRQALLADVTHELRTPLTVISGGIEAMLDGVHPMDEDHLAPLLAETRVMARLVEDLRTLSLAEAGALPLHREPVDLLGIAREVVAAHAAVARSAGVELAATGSAVVTSVDPVRIREVVANLVANAVRHTPHGGTVTVEVVERSGVAELTVRDTGEGIAPEDLARVFERFHRRADSGGSGLGLAIVRDLVAAHGGTVEAESEGVPGRGTTFRVRLPVRD